MLKIRILCLGSIKEKYLKQGIDEYLKRLKPYANVSIIELPDSPIPSREEDCKIMLKGEADKLQSKLEGITVLLDLEGKELSSEAMAQQIANWALYGNSTITFIIGSSLGVDESLKNKWTFVGLLDH